MVIAPRSDHRLSKSHSFSYHWPFKSWPSHLKTLPEGGKSVIRHSYSSRPDLKQCSLKRMDMPSGRVSERWWSMRTALIGISIRIEMCMLHWDETPRIKSFIEQKLGTQNRGYNFNGWRSCHYEKNEVTRNRCTIRRDVYVSLLWVPNEIISRDFESKRGNGTVCPVRLQRVVRCFFLFEKHGQTISCRSGTAAGPLQNSEGIWPPFLWQVSSQVRPVTTKYLSSKI